MSENEKNENVDFLGTTCTEAEMEEVRRACRDFARATLARVPVPPMELWLIDGYTAMEKAKAFYDWVKESLANFCRVYCVECKSEPPLPKFENWLKIFGEAAMEQQVKSKEGQVSNENT